MKFIIILIFSFVVTAVAEWLIFRQTALTDPKRLLAAAFYFHWSFRVMLNKPGHIVDTIL